ncbi:phage portal protein [Glycomyces sp. NPDC048151]|uniref:phage portal protein n=1 Tax=Glycomyces sp. NPDC048151 TaxID=3364002 RepID=UPI003715FB48
MSPTDWWLDRLAHTLDRRRPALTLLRRYLDGDAPLPEGAEGCRDSYKEFQRKSRSNWAELIVEAVAERMIVSGWRVGDLNEDDDAARAVWKRNRLGMWAADVHRDMIGLGAGYVCVQRDARDPDRAEIVYERPEQVACDHDPARPDRVRAGLKVYRDDVSGLDAAYVHVLGDDGLAYVERFERATPVNRDGIPQPIQTVAGQWAPALDAEGFRLGPQPTGLRHVPLVPFVNRSGRSEFGSHLDLIDRINWGVLQRLVITAMQAYKQRATKGDLPETDETGTPIDYAALFRPGPGALWHLPEGVELWESGVTDVSGILTASRDDVRDLAALTRTPMSMLLPDNTNQSAEGAAAAREGLVFKTGDRLERAGPSWSLGMGLALQIEQGLNEVPEVDVQWRPPERQSLTERLDALSKAGSDIPWRTKMARIMQFDGDEIDRMAIERAEDLLTTAPAPPLATAPGRPAPEQSPEPDADGR